MPGRIAGLRKVGPEKYLFPVQKSITISSRNISPFTTSVDQITERQWHEILPSFEDACVYETWAYGAVSWGQQNLSHLVLQEGRQVVGMAQFRIFRLPVVSSGIAYLRWGPLYRLRGQMRQAEILSALLRAIRDEYATRRRLLVSILPNAFEGETSGEDFKAALLSAGFRQNTAFAPHRTICVDLAPTLESMRKSLDQKWRNQLNVAERNGLSILEGSGDELFAEFMGVYRDMLARKKFKEGISIENFARIQASLPGHLKMRIILCRKEGRILNGIVIGSYGDTAVYLLGATNDEGTKAKGSYLLQWRAMQWLKENGVKWYDLGGINPQNNPGVYHFKSGFGGKELSRLGEYRLSDSALSSAAVAIGERLRTGLGSLISR